jgi:hypothetical protein
MGSFAIMTTRGRVHSAKMLRTALAPKFGSTSVLTSETVEGLDLGLFTIDDARLTKLVRIMEWAETRVPALIACPRKVASLSQNPINTWLTANGTGRVERP